MHLLSSLLQNGICGADENSSADAAPDTRRCATTATRMSAGPPYVAPPSGTSSPIVSRLKNLARSSRDLVTRIIKTVAIAEIHQSHT